jgi:hypothetical protein
MMGLHWLIIYFYSFFLLAGAATSVLGVLSAMTAAISNPLVIIIFGLELAFQAMGGYYIFWQKRAWANEASPIKSDATTPVGANDGK